MEPSTEAGINNNLWFFIDRLLVQGWFSQVGLDQSGTMSVRCSCLAFTHLYCTNHTVLDNQEKSGRNQDAHPSKTPCWSSTPMLNGRSSANSSFFEP